MVKNVALLVSYARQCVQRLLSPLMQKSVMMVQDEPNGYDAFSYSVGGESIDKVSLSIILTLSRSQIIRHSYLLLIGSPSSSWQ